MAVPHNCGNDDFMGYDDDDVTDSITDEDEEDELEMLMASIEKIAAEDKEASEIKAQDMEDNEDWEDEPSNRVDLDAEDEHDEFLLKYDPEKMGLNGEEYEDVDDYALVESGAHHDMDGEIIYQGSRRKHPTVELHEAAAVLEKTKNEVNDNGVGKKEKEATMKPPPNPAEQDKKYRQWGFVAAAKADKALVPAPPPPTPSTSGMDLVKNEKTSPPQKRSRWN